MKKRVLSALSIALALALVLGTLASCSNKPKMTNNISVWCWNPQLQPVCDEGSGRRLQQGAPRGQDRRRRAGQLRQSRREGHLWPSGRRRGACPAFPVPGLPDRAVHQELSERFRRSQGRRRRLFQVRRLQGRPDDRRRCNDGFSGNRRIIDSQQDLQQREHTRIRDIREFPDNRPAQLRRGEKEILQKAGAAFLSLIQQFRQGHLQRSADFRQERRKRGEVTSTPYPSSAARNAAFPSSSRSLRRRVIWMS